MLRYLWAATAIVAMMFIAGCEDKSIVRINDKSFLAHPPTCLKLAVFPSDPVIERALADRYRFDPRCPWQLAIDTKSGIHCNSNQNAQRKALTAFPNSYLRVSIRRGMRTLYSYYIDRTRPADLEAILDAFSRISKDIDIFAKIENDD